MIGTGLGGLPHGLGFPLGVTFSAYESCNGDGIDGNYPFSVTTESGVITIPPFLG